MPVSKGMFALSIGFTSGMTNLKERRALVTGGSRGIGAEIVRRLAADGAAVAFTYGSSATDADKLVAEVTADGGTAVAIQADSGDPEQVASSVDEAASSLGGLDILVNNAGVAHIADAESFPLEQFERLVAINVRGVFVASQRALRTSRRGRPHHQHRQHQRRPGTRSGTFRLRHDQRGRRRIHPWTGP